MDRPIQGSGLLGLVTDAAQLRAAHYRDQASLLRQMAEAESLMRLRGNLLNLAHNTRIITENLRWLLSKLQPKKWGDRMLVADNPESPIEHLHRPSPRT